MATDARPSRIGTIFSKPSAGVDSSRAAPVAPAGDPRREEESPIHGPTSVDLRHAMTDSGVSQVHTRPTLLLGSDQRVCRSRTASHERPKVRSRLLVSVVAQESVAAKRSG